MNKTYALIISLVAGMSTLIGYLFIYIKGDKDKLISKCLGFASGVMITLSITDLLPSSINNLSINCSCIKTIIYSFIMFWFGFFSAYFISKIVKESDNKLYKAGIITMIGILLHNLPEGIATFVLSTIDLKLGILLAVAIILHNIPEGISIAIPIYYSTNSKRKAFFYTLLSGIAEPIGGILALLLLYKYINTFIIGLLFSFIAGLMIYIGYFELLKISFKYKNKKSIILYFILGIILILAVELLLKI